MNKKQENLIFKVIFVIFLLLGASLFLVGCSWILPISSPESEFVIPETTKIFDSETVASLAKVDPDGTLFFSQPTDLLRQLNVGDVLICGVTPVTPHGLLRKVSDIKMINGQLVVSTTQAALEEAIEKGVIEFSGFLTPESFSTQPSGLSTDPISNAPLTQPFYLRFENIVLYDQDGKADTKDDQIRLHGNISFSPQINLRIKLDNGLRNFYFTVEVTHTTEIVVEYALASVSFSVKRDLWSQALTPIVVWLPTLPPLPIVILPVVTVSGGAAGELGAQLQMRVIQMGRMKAGIVYDGKEWTLIREAVGDFHWDPLRFSAEGGIKAYLGPQFNLLFYGLVGPYAMIRGFLEFIAGAQVPAIWELYGGVELAGGARLAILTRKLIDLEFPLTLGYRKLLARGQEGRPPTATTGQAINITPTSATLTAVVNPNGLPTSAYFEWGTTNTYGNKTSPQFLGGGTNDINVSSELRGLSPNTTYYFRVVAENSAGVSYGANVSFKTLSQNIPPVANIKATPSSGQAPLTVTFDGANSYDPDGVISKYEWDFGDGATAAGVVVSHTYYSPGVYLAKLSVTDDRGAIGTASVTIEVSACTNQPRLWTNAITYCIGDPVEIYITVSAPSYIDLWVSYPDGSIKYLVQKYFCSNPNATYLFKGKAGEPAGLRKIYLKAEACGQEVTVAHNIEVKLCADHPLPRPNLTVVFYRESPVVVDCDMPAYLVVKNLGNADVTTAFEIHIYMQCLDGSVVLAWAEVVQGLSIGGIKQWALNMCQLLKCPYSGYKVCWEAIVDPTNKIIESNENDNKHLLCLSFP